MEKVAKVLMHLKKFSSEILDLAPPLRDSRLIGEFENKYKLRLPNDYKWFVSMHDGLSLMGDDVYGFSGDENILTAYDFEHFCVQYPMPEYLVPFSPDGRGNFYCFDTRFHSNESCLIVFWTSNYEYTEDDQPEITNRSFTDWIDEVLISWTLETYDYNGNSI